MASRRMRSCPWIGVACLLGCSLTEGVDVCDRTPGVESEVNREPEGRQVTRTHRAVVPLPTGDAFVTFLSDDGDPSRGAVRGTLLDRDGRPIDTCGDRTEQTYSVFRPDGPADQAAASPLYIAPSQPDRDGFLVWVHVDGELDGADPVELRVEGRFVGTDGCVAFEDERASPIVLADAPPGTLVGTLGGARLEGGGTEDRFVVVYPRLPRGFGPGGGVYARVFREGADGLPLYDPVVDPDTGEPLDGSAPVRLSDLASTSLDVVALGGGRFAVLVQQLDDRASQVVRLAVFDDRLSPVTPFRTLDRWERSVPSVQPALAFDGERLLAVWSRRDPQADERPRLVAALLDASGRLLATPHAPAGVPFFLVEDPARRQTDPTATALPDGRGFLVAWSASVPDEIDDGVRAVLLEPDGNVAFANAACERTDFRPHGPLSGRQEHPAAAVLGDGGVLIVWTDEGANGPDRSGASVRALRGDPRSLLPLR